MSTVTPPPPPPPPVAQTTGHPTAVVSNPPANLTSVAVGARIDAIIVATTPDGRVEVETRLGRFLIQPTIQLPKEGAIQLQVLTLARQIFLSITSIHGKQPFAALRDLRLASQVNSRVAPFITGTSKKGSIGATHNPNIGSGMLAIGKHLTATLSIPAGLALTPPGVSINKANPINKIAKGGSTNSTSGIQVAAAYGSQITKPLDVKGLSFPNTGELFNVRISAITSPILGAPAPTSSNSSLKSSFSNHPSLVPGQSVSGIIIPTASKSLTVLQTKFGPLFLNAPQNLPVGTTIQIDILALISDQNYTGNNDAGARKAKHFFFQNRSWPALDDTLGGLREINPQMALNLINMISVQPDSMLTANIIRFILGIRSGDLYNRIADGPLRVLTQDKPNLVKRLRDDFRALSRIADEPASGDWRALPIPLTTGAAIEQIQLLMRRLGSNEKDEELRQGPGTRFIIDVNLSRLGRIQLDGLLTESNKIFDLMIRSDQKFLPKMQADILSIFETAQGITGLTGWLRFQAAPPNFIDVFAHVPESEIGLLV